MAETPIETPMFSLFVYVSIKAREMRGGGGEEERGRGRGTAKGESNNYGTLTVVLLAGSRTPDSFRLVTIAQPQLPQK